MKRTNATVTPWAGGQGQAPPLAAPGAPPGTETQTAVPARPAGFVPDVIVPLAQAAICGALVGGLVVLVASELLPDRDLDWLKLWGAAALAVTAVAWFVLLGQTRKLLWAIENVIGLDLNQDGTAGRPQERVVIVNAGQAQQEAARREGEQRASEFARFVAALPTKGTAARSWEKELGREKYQEYRDALIRLGWAAWNSTDDDGRPNERRGWDLTIDAGEILRRIG